MSEEKHPRKHIAAPENKEAYVEGMFTDIAPRYDLLNSLLSMGGDARWRRQAARYCHV